MYYNWIFFLILSPAVPRWPLGFDALLHVASSCKGDVILSKLFKKWNIKVIP